MDVIVLAGQVGAEPAWTGGTPRALLPLPATTLCRALIDRLRRNVPCSVTICSHRLAKTLDETLNRGAQPNGVARLIEDRIPRGTAGCAKACEPFMGGDVVFISSGTIWLEDDAAELVEKHRKSGNDLTVFGRPLGSNGQLSGPPSMRPAGVYCCNRSVLDQIPDKGFFDIKEQLVPKLLAAGMRVGAIALHRMTSEITTWSAYLQVLRTALEREFDGSEEYRRLAPGFWCGNDVSIADSARVAGPVLLDHGTRLHNGAVVMGPAILGPNSVVATDAWLVRVVATAGLTLPPQAMVADGVLSCKNMDATPLPDAHAQAAQLPRDPKQSEFRHNDTPSAGGNGLYRTGRSSTLLNVLLGGILIASTTVLAFPHTVADLWEVWTTNPDYGAGAIVPLAAVYMIAQRLGQPKRVRPTFDPLGLVVFLVGVAIHLSGIHYLFRSLELAGMVICVQALILTVYGRAVVRTVWFPLLFLFFMLPLPHRVHGELTLPLQTTAARMSAAVLELAGYPADCVGNTLRIAGYPLEVADACNGLRMAFAFLIVGGVIVFLARLHRSQKLLVFLSLIPIALACNVTRIVITAILVSQGVTAALDGRMHEWAGILMMPLAIVAILIEIRLLQRIAPLAEPLYSTHAGTSAIPGYSERAWA